MKRDFPERLAPDVRRSPVGTVLLMVMCCAVMLVSACGSRSGASDAPADARTRVHGNASQLTTADVTEILEAMDATWSVAVSGRVNVPRFAKSILLQLPAEDGHSKPKDERRRRAAVERAADVYAGLEARRGREVAVRMLDNLQFYAVEGSEPASRGLTADEIAIAPLATGMRAATLMFSHGDTPMWNWEIKSISIVGTSTARVSYAVTPASAAELGRVNPLAFKKSGRTYQKILRFRWASQGWQLASWPNFLEFERALEANVRPKSLVTGFGWWESGPPQ